MPSETTPVISVKAVSKDYTLYPRPADRLFHLIMPWLSYPVFPALSDISLDVLRGETVGIIGQNGAGKSTLLQIITGTSPPTTGEAATNGRIAALLELGAGFEPEFTGRENIFLNATVLGLSEDLVAERLDRIIAFSELNEFIDRPVKTYSSGMYMRLAFAVAAHVDADVLIIDEALSVGDARFTQKCMRFLADFKNHGSILFVSHDLAAVTALCDRAVWLNRGRIEAIGDPSKVCEDYLASLFPAPGSRPSAPVSDTVSSPDKVSGETVVFDSENPLAPPGISNISPFHPEGRAFGEGGAQIIDVGFWSTEGDRLSSVSDGEEVELRLTVDVAEPVAQPIFGFFIKDRMGQNLMGDNTFSELQAAVPLKPGERISGRFRFAWPSLIPGAYALTVALADGTVDDHIQRHWIHEALMIEVLSSSVRHGIVGLSFSRVSIVHEEP